MGKRIAGFLALHPALILWLSVLGYLRPRLTLGFLGAAAFHELGHLLALWAMDARPDALRLGLFGAALDIPAMGYGQSLFCYASGPLFSFLLWGLSPWLPTAAGISLCLGLFNLLPISGLDGAGMLSCLLCLRWEPARADRLCLWVSRCTAALVLLGGLMGLRAGLGPGPLLISVALFLRAMGLLPL